jgi:hypothetical protein
MLEHISPILEGFFSFVVSGGLAWILYPKLKRREQKNEVYIKEYHEIEKIIEDFVLQNTTLANKVSTYMNEVHRIAGINHSQDALINA